MAVYQKVYGDFWFDTKQWREDEKIFALYLLTTEHGSSEGLFKLPVVYAVEDMQWSMDRVADALAALQARKWAVYDREWMLVTKKLRHDPPKGDKSILGAVRRVERAPRPSAVWSSFVAAADRHAPPFAMALRATYGDPIDAPSMSHGDESESPIGPTSTNTSNNQSTRHEQQQTARTPEPSWFDECVEAGQAKRSPWASSLETLSEQRQRCEALLSECDEQTARSVRRDVLDAVRGGQIRKSLPEAVRAFINTVERNGVAAAKPADDGRLDRFEGLGA